MTEERSKQHAKKTLVVGVGGATSSGKTTLAKHLLALLPSRKGVMLHQDDFALPEAELPWNEALQARDWDNPVGTIDYRRMESILQHTRVQGDLPPHHTSHDHLNLQPDRPLDASLDAACRSRLNEALASAQVDCIVIADGFLLYYDSSVRRQMDVRLFLRCNRATLERRRTERGGYATAEGTVWQDPPGYFEHVIWTGYVQAHKALFEDDDVEHGAPRKVEQDLPDDGAPVKDLILIEAEQNDVNETVKIAVEELAGKIEQLSKRNAS